MTNTNNAINGQGSDVAQTEQSISNNAMVTPVVVEPLTSIKAEKLSLFMPYFKGKTEEFVRKCSGRGENAWKKVAAKITAIDTADLDHKAYIDRLYAEFDLDQPYILSELVTQVSEIRRDMGLPIEVSGPKWYIQQLSDIFLIEKLNDSNSSTKIDGYKFIYKLAPVN